MCACVYAYYLHPPPGEKVLQGSPGWPTTCAEIAEFTLSSPVNMMKEKSLIIFEEPTKSEIQQQLQTSAGVASAVCRAVEFGPALSPLAPLARWKRLWCSTLRASLRTRAEMSGCSTQARRNHHILLWALTPCSQKPLCGGNQSEVTGRRVLGASPYARIC